MKKYQLILLAGTALLFSACKEREQSVKNETKLPIIETTKQDSIQKIDSTTVVKEKEIVNKKEILQNKEISKKAISEVKIKRLLKKLFLRMMLIQKLKKKQNLLQI